MLFERFHVIGDNCCVYIHFRSFNTGLRNRSRRGGLPYGGWIPRTDLDCGLLGGARAEDVVIPANLGFHRGTWFLIIEGIRGVLVRDRAAGPVVYMVTEPSTNYYRNMTEQEPMMPELVGQVI